MTPTVWSAAHEEMKTKSTGILKRTQMIARRQSDGTYRIEKVTTNRRKTVGSIAATAVGSLMALAVVKFAAVPAVIIAGIFAASSAGVNTRRNSKYLNRNLSFEEAQQTLISFEKSQRWFGREPDWRKLGPTGLPPSADDGHSSAELAAAQEEIEAFIAGESLSGTFEERVRIHEIKLLGDGKEQKPAGPSPETKKPPQP